MKFFDRGMVKRGAGPGGQEREKEKTIWHCIQRFLFEACGQISRVCLLLAAGREVVPLCCAPGQALCASASVVVFEGCWVHLSTLYTVLHCQKKNKTWDSSSSHGPKKTVRFVCVCFRGGWMLLQSRLPYLFHLSYNEYTVVGGCWNCCKYPSSSKHCLTVRFHVPTKG